MMGFGSSRLEPDEVIRAAAMDVGGTRGTALFRVEYHGQGAGQHIVLQCQHDGRCHPPERYPWLRPPWRPRRTS